MREKAELERENTIQRMSLGEVFAREDRRVDAFAEKLEYAPTADVASRSREHMAEVLRVATTSRNLQGSFVKILKQAAACGVAATEVLRTRADRGEGDDETSWQIRAMRRELAEAKRDAQTARAEAESLRRELAAEKERGGRATRRRAIIVDDSPPASPKEKWAERRPTVTENRGKPPEEEEVSPMEVEIGTTSEEPPRKRGGSTTTKKGGRRFSLRESNGRRRYAQNYRARSRSSRKVY